MTICFFSCGQVSSQEMSWTHFRGSSLNGTALNEDIPLKWDDLDIKWKTKIHDNGYSSPVVYDDQVWVTAAKPDGKELYAVCTDFKCRHAQGPASSPVIYKNLLILHFEGTDVRYIIALDKSNGKQIWRSDRPAEPYEPLTEIGRKAYIVAHDYFGIDAEEVWQIIKTRFLS